jgi:uncharacterized membrane protein (Fun14 family)
MFCDGCGAALAPDQNFCSRCGKQVVAGVPTGYARENRVRTHIRLIGILWLALSAFSVLGGVVLMIIANTLFGHLSRYGAVNAPGFLQPLLSFVSIFILGKACLGFIAGWGLLQQQHWARMVALVVAFLSLFNIPLGTALGIYTLWTLLPAESEQEYEQLAMVPRHV